MMPVGPRRPPDLVKMMQRQMMDDGRPNLHRPNGAGTMPLVQLPHGMVPAGRNDLITGLGIHLASVRMGWVMPRIHWSRWK